MPEQHQFLPYARQVICEEDIEAVVAVLRSDYLTTGPLVSEFERRLAERHEVRYAVAVSSGTAALHSAAYAAGLGPGDTVAVPAVTFVASANCARYIGAEPVFVDVLPDSALIDLDALDTALSEGARATVPVHMTGRPVDMERVAALAARTGAIVIEDAAHALGTTWQGRPVGGRHAHMSILSFHPVKHVTTGEGGAVVTDDPRLYQRLVDFRNHGLIRDPARLEQPAPGPWYYEQQELGYNYRLTDMQCALGISQLGRLDEFLGKRRALAARYDDLLADVEHVRPAGDRDPRGVSAWHLYAVLIDFDAARVSRSDLMLALRARGIGTQVHYIPVPWQPYYRRRGWRPESFPGAARWYERTLSLPLYPGMKPVDVERVVAALREELDI